MKLGQTLRLVSSYWSILFAGTKNRSTWSNNHLIVQSLVSMTVLWQLVSSGLPQSMRPQGSETRKEGNRTVISVPLSIQEATFSGIRGISRHHDPVTVGIPLPDSAGIKETSQLGLSGATVAQFRVLGRWPSGNIQWVLVDTQADLAAGGIRKDISLTAGSGDFGGPQLAMENPSEVVISTGAAKFTVRKQSFNFLDQVEIGGRTLLQNGGSAGLAIEGPAPGNTVCPCTTLYSSANDDRSDAAIEENGPVRAVVRAHGQLKDEAGHVYMRYTVRLHFFHGKTRVKAVVQLQNADYGPSGSSTSAFKGFRSFEIRVSPVLQSGRSFRFGTARSTVNGSYADTDNAYLYQAYSDKLEQAQWSSPDTRSLYAPRSFVKRTLAAAAGSHRSWNYSQEGCNVLHNNSSLRKEGKSDYCEGWADISDRSGAGVEIGVYQMAAFWPKSLEFIKGASDIRIGIWPDQSLFGAGGQDYYQPWPQYSIHTIYLNFHAADLPDPQSEFDKFQYPLIARASVGHYNDSGALMYPIVDPGREDNYFRSLGLACCAKDLSEPHVYRTYGWRAAGSGNQAEMRWANLMFWLQRGHVARYLDAAHFYLFQSEQVFPRSDYDGNLPFDWRDRPDSDLDAGGFPKIQSLNSDIGCDPGEKACGRNWIDNAHAHWYGMMDYYFLTGDETVRDAIGDGASDIYGNPNVMMVKNGKYWSSRNIGEALMSDARLARFYRSTGNNKSADRALDAGTQILAKQVWPELSVSGFGDADQGVSRTRGVQFGCCPPNNRFAMPFQAGILSEGLWEFMQAQGPTWPKRQFTFDLAYAIASWVLNEAWQTNSSVKGCTGGSGLAYEIFLDRPNPALTPSCVHTVWFNFYNYSQYVGRSGDWKQKFELYLKHINGNGVFYGEIGTIFEGAVIGQVLTSPPTRLIDIPLKAERTGNVYHLSWTAPPNVQRYRLKYSDKNIVEWLDFNPHTQTYRLNPADNVPWFAAEELATVPGPSKPGIVETYDVRDLDSRHNWRFSLRAYTNNTN